MASVPLTLYSVPGSAKAVAKSTERLVLVMLANLQVWYDVALLVHATTPFQEEHSKLMVYVKQGSTSALNIFAGCACQGWRKPCVTLVALRKDLAVLH